jgi:quercetin dioxygenase-like cupin family protein
MVDVTRDELLLELAALESLEPETRPLTDAERTKLDPEYVGARDGFERVASLLALAPAPVAPPPSLKERLMDRVAKDAEARPGAFTVKPGVVGIRTEEAPWQQTALRGVETKVLHRDRERGYTTRLLRVPAGTGYPYHVHAGTEEIYMLEGTLWVNGVLLKAGDYCRSEAGTDERGTFSPTGAMAVVVSCDADDVQPSASDMR